MSKPQRVRRPEDSSLRIAVLASLALYAFLFAGLALLPPVAQPQRKGEAAGVTVLLDGGPPAGDGSAPRGGTVVAARSDYSGRGSAPRAAKPRPARDRTRAAEGPAGGAAAPARVGGKPPRADDPAVLSGGAGPAADAAASVPGDRGPAIDAAASVPAGQAAEPEGGGGADGATAAVRGQERPAGAGGGTGGAGDAKPGPTGTAVSGESGDAGALALLDLIRERIERDRSYPFAARLRGIEGTVTASITVDGKGDLSAERVVRTSGSAILDRAGLALLRRVFPVPNETGAGFDLEVRIAYRLLGGGGSE